MLRRGALLGGECGTLFVLDLFERLVGARIGERLRGPYRNLKVYRLIRKRGHFIAEAKAVLAQIICREDELALPLLVSLGYDALAGGEDLVVDVE